MGPEYLFNVPVHIFHFYIQLFNDRVEQGEFEDRAAQMAKNSVKDLPDMVGNTVKNKPQ